jgi:hypothetical protein
LAKASRLTQVELHERFVKALEGRIVAHSDLELKPLELDFVPPLPPRVRVYLFNATRPPGGRPVGEFKIQVMVPGQARGDRACFDASEGHLVILAGYTAEEDVFILWDAGLYRDFSWSRNVQVKSDTVMQAFAGAIGHQERETRPAGGGRVVETVLTASASRLSDAIKLRTDLTRQRLLGET